MRMSGSKIIPLIATLKHSLTEIMAQNSNDVAKQLGINLSRILNDKLSGLQRAKCSRALEGVGQGCCESKNIEECIC